MKPAPDSNSRLSDLMTAILTLVVATAAPFAGAHGWDTGKHIQVIVFPQIAFTGFHIPVEDVMLVVPEADKNGDKKLTAGEYEELKLEIGKRIADNISFRNDDQLLRSSDIRLDVSLWEGLQQFIQEFKVTITYRPPAQKKFGIVYVNPQVLRNIKMPPMRRAQLASRPTTFRIVDRGFEVVTETTGTATYRTPKWDQIHQ